MQTVFAIYLKSLSSLKAKKLFIKQLEYQNELKRLINLPQPFIQFLAASTKFS